MSNTVNNYTETDLGNISLNPRGEYDNSAAYEYLDTVSYQGGSYFCLTELETTITGITPDAGRNSEHWQMIAAPGDMTPEYTATYNDVIKKAVQVGISRAAVELAQQEIEAVQTDVQQLHSDTVQTAQEAENSKNSAANSAQSAEQSRKTVSESEQNINEQIAGFDSRVSEAVEQSKEEINTAKQQAIDTIANQQNTSVNTVKTEGEKIITRVGNDAKTVANDRATVEEATQTVLNNAQEVAQNTQIVASNTKNAAASAESAKNSADNAAQSAKSVEDASKQIEQNKKDVASLKEDLASEISRATAAEETKADKTSLAQTDRKLDALWKLNQGITYEFQTDDTEAYQKTVPSGAKVANVKSIGGKTIVWNQFAIMTDEKDENGLVVTVDRNTSKFTVNGKSTGNVFIGSRINDKSIIGHKILFRLGASIPGTTTYATIEYPSSAYIKGIGGIRGAIFDVGENNKEFFPWYIYVDETDVVFDNVTFTPQLFDLTKMFGEGNEPSTPEEFEAMFPSDYYPYNAGELMSAPVNEVVEQGKNFYPGSDLIELTKAYVTDFIPVTLCKGKLCFSFDAFTDTSNGNYLIDVQYFDANKERVGSNGKADTVGNNISHMSFEFDGSNAGSNYETLDLKNVSYIKIKFGIYNNTATQITYKNIMVSTTDSDFEPYHKTSYPIPQAILNLPGYGWSAGDARNEVNWENKQYIQRVGKYVITGDESFETRYMPTIVFNNSDYAIKPGLQATNNRGLNINAANNFGNDWQFNITDLGLDKNATTDDIKEWFKKHPVTVYYPMFNEEIINISDIIGATFQEPLEVEAGGTLTFKNSNGDNYQIPVSSSEEYLVSLAEVAK